MGLLLASCGGNALTEKVVKNHENGQPSVIYYFDRDGHWVREADYYETGALMMEGPVENDLRTGTWTSYFPDGKVQSTGFYENGLRTGKAEIYYENGHLWMDGWYHEDQKCGEWIVYDEQSYELMRVNYGSCD